MKKEESILLIKKYVEDINKTNRSAEFCVKTKESNFEIEGLQTDIRIEKMDYVEIYIMDKIKEIAVGKVTLLFLDENEYNKVYFWKKDENNNMLKKISLENYKEFIGKVCIILAYTEIGTFIEKDYEIKYKCLIVKFYINLYNFISKKMKVFSYLEPTGIIMLTEDKQKKDYLIINEDVDEECLGKVFEESVPADKISKKLGMYEVKNLYQGTTCGKIYFSKKVEE